MMKNDPWKTDPQRRLTPEERKERIEKIRRIRRRRKIIAGFVLLLVAALIAVPVVIFTAFRLKTINVKTEGTVPYSNEEIIAACPSKAGENVLFLKPEECAAGLAEKLPYLAGAKVTKQLPSTLNITVSGAKEEFALFTKEGNVYLVLDANLKILAKSTSFPGGVITIIAPPPTSTQPGETLSFVEKKEGEEVPDDLFTAISEIAKSIKTEKLKKIDQIDVSDITDIRAVYDGRIMLKFGSPSDTASKINLAASAIKEEDERNAKQMGTIDLSISKIAYFKPNYFDGKKVEAEDTEDEETTDENGETVTGQEEGDTAAQQENEGAGNGESDGESGNDGGEEEEYREYYEEND